MLLEAVAGETVEAEQDIVGGWSIESRMRKERLEDGNDDLYR